MRDITRAAGRDPRAGAGRDRRRRLRRGLEHWRVEYLGRRGALNEVLRGLGALPAAERPAAGQAANAVKEALEAALRRARGGAEGDRAGGGAGARAARRDAARAGRRGWAGCTR